MKNVLFFTVALSMTFVAQVHADGNELLQNCNKFIQFVDNPPENPDFGQIGFCLGMVQGVMYLNYVYENRLGSDALFCGPEGGINNGQASRIVVKYLKDNPQELHRHEGSLVIKAFMVAYPCD